MATAAERMRAHRERMRRGLRRLTIDVSEDDLHRLAERGGQAQAVALFVTDAVVGDAVTARCGATSRRRRKSRPSCPRKGAG
jgi:hypothetical protein